MKLKTVCIALVFLSAIALVTFVVVSKNHHDAGPVLYGQVLFGHKEQDEPASRLTHCMMVQGDKIFVDRNGDLIPQHEEQLAERKMAPFSHPVLGTTFEITKLDLGVAPDSVSDTLAQKLILYVDIGDEKKYTMSGKMELTADSQNMNWLHFGGPLQFLEMEELVLKPSNESPSELKLFLGTIAIGPIDRPFAQDTDRVTLSANSKPRFRTTIVIPTEQPPYPRANIEFEMPNGEPVSQELVMDQFC